MDTVFQLMMYLLPALLVFVSNYFVIKSFMDREYRSKLAEIRKANHAQLTPIRLQASERVLLFLERIAINSLVVRVHRNGMSARLLHTELLTAIRSEFDHNISQQLYLSSATWDAVKNAKEETIRAINISASKLRDDAPGIDLCNLMLDLTTKVDKLPTDYAIQILKAEIRQLF
jgi:hypothetical protein